MCMEDIRIGRKTQSRVGFVTLAGAALEIVPGSPKRIALMLGGNNAGRVTFNNQPIVVIDQGLTIVIGSGPLMLDIQTHGELVTKPWYAITSAAGTVAFAETILVDD